MIVYIEAYKLMKNFLEIKQNLLLSTNRSSESFSLCSSEIDFANKVLAMEDFNFSCEVNFLIPIRFINSPEKIKKKRVNT